MPSVEYVEIEYQANVDIEDVTVYDHEVSTCFDPS